MQFTRLYLDTNIFIRAFEGEADRIANGLVEAFDRSKGKSAFVTSEISLAELLVEPIKSGNAARRGYYENLLSPHSTWLTVVPVSRPLLIAAAQNRVSRKLRLPDAIHAATASASNCSHILSLDTDFGSTALLPDEATLDAIIAWLSP